MTGRKISKTNVSTPVWNIWLLNLSIHGVSILNCSAMIRAQRTTDFNVTTTDKIVRIFYVYRSVYYAMNILKCTYLWDSKREKKGDI